MARDLPPSRDRSRIPLLLKRPAAPDAPGGSLRHFLLHRWPGRLLLGAMGTKVLLWLLEALVGTSGVIETLNTLVAVALLITLAWFLSRLLLITRQRFLWRVRRRLVVSYVFIGVVPALLLMAFALLGATLMILNVSGYLFKNGVDDLVRDARLIAQVAADEIARSPGPRAVETGLARRFDNNQTRYPGLSLAYLPRISGTRPAAAAVAPSTTAATAATAAAAPVRAGEWEHSDAPAVIPAWVSAGGYGGILAYRPGDAQELQLVVRGIAFATDRDPRYGVVVDIPIDEQVMEQLHQTTGIEPGAVSLVRDQDEPIQPGIGRAASQPLMRQIQAGAWLKGVWNWAAFLDFTDWRTGRTGSVTMGFRVDVREIFRRVSTAQSRVFNLTIAELTLMMLGFIAVLFLIIEVAAFVMGFTLARSITRSVHALFDGTERVRFGDFGHRIEVKDRDQLGELAESFNAMTANIEDLLQQAQEKRRLEEELRIAREIQMSLLPRGVVHMAGLAVTALCVPAREVGGDYYDFFRLADRRFGVLIADVAGKGTSAALYMAELKGLVLSLSKICHSPRQLLIEVNSILSENLDRRSFITMTYAVFDLAQKTVTYARAGHTPLIHLPAVDGTRRQARLLTPNGMVVGLRLEGFETHFEMLLEEISLPLCCGDVLVLFTDGITEAMNADGDLFGDDRLRDLVEEHADLPSEQLRERILREVESFVGDADPHDDMTMILLKVEEEPAA